MLGPLVCTLALALTLPATLLLVLNLIGHKTSPACRRHQLLDNLLGHLDQLGNVLFLKRAVAKTLLLLIPHPFD